MEDCYPNKEMKMKAPSKKGVKPSFGNRMSEALKKKKGKAPVTAYA